VVVGQIESIYASCSPDDVARRIAFSILTILQLGVDKQCLANLKDIYLL
jgi:hypothetical protein